MASTLTNIWHLRTVGEASSKACYVCYKPTIRVLITPDNKDYFYVCQGHLSDRGFATPVIDAEAEAAKQKQEALEQAIEKVKQEYEEKQRRKEEKKKEAKDNAKDKDVKKKELDEVVESEKQRDDKTASRLKMMSGPQPEDIPRIYSLHKNFYSMRLDRLRNTELAKRNHQRLKDPSIFPSAPKGEI